MAATYRIADEPKPSTLSHMAVDPLWPLLALMFVGPWLSWPWFLLNGEAMGAPSRKPSVLLVVAGFLGAFVLTLAIRAMEMADVLPAGSAAYAWILLTGWKLLISYWLYVIQARTFGLYEYYGGRAKSGLFAVIIGFFVDQRVVGPALGGFLSTVLS